MTRNLLAISTLAVVIVAGALGLSAQGGGQAPPGPGAQGQGRGQNQQPARDRAARPQPAGTARISGRVVDAESGRPMRRARVMLNGAELPGGRGAMTDDDGNFSFTGLPAGRYTVNASRSGYVTVSFGQRRPRQPGTPLQLADGQQLSRIDIRLPRGGVVTGQIFDDTGEPLVGASVSVQRYEYAQGARQLVPAGQGSTDDRGMYRIWGLNPGSYYVTATARNFNMAAGPLLANAPAEAAAAIEQAFAAIEQAGQNLNIQVTGLGVDGGRGVPPALGGRGGRGGQFFAAGTAAPAADAVAYAPTYYPGVSQPSDAQAVTVALGAEMSNVNFAIQMVRTARINGRVATVDGKPATFGNVQLINEGGRGPGMNLGGRINGDGSFAINMVPPGRYTLRARAGERDNPQFAQQSIGVADGDVQDLAITLSPGATISGTVTFQATTSATVPDASQVRLVAPTTDFATPGPTPVARVERSGQFTLSGVMAGEHWMRAQGNLRGWMIRSVTLDGRDVTDTPFEVRGGQALSGMTVVFTDRVSEINGTLTDNQQTPLTEYTVLAFPADNTLWRPQSRYIMTSRPDQTGKFQLRGLPPGDYYLAAIDPEESGEWFEPAFLEPLVGTAARISLGEGDVKTQNFKLAQ